jgi:hypothetical protein
MIEVTIEIQDKYKDRIVTAFRNMKPYLPGGATDLQVFQYRVKRMIRDAVIRSEMNTAKNSVTIPDDLVEPE